MPIRSDDMNFYYGWTAPDIDRAELAVDVILKHLQAARTAYEVARDAGLIRDCNVEADFDDIGAQLGSPLSEIADELDRRSAILEREHERRETAAVRR